MRNGRELFSIVYQEDETFSSRSSPGLMHDTGCLGLVHWDDPEGGYEEGGYEKGGGFRMGNTGIPVADSFRYLQN